MIPFGLRLPARRLGSALTSAMNATRRDTSSALAGKDARPPLGFFATFQRGQALRFAGARSCVTNQSTTDEHEWAQIKMRSINTVRCQTRQILCSPTLPPCR
jgi:hypothetical protein